MILVQGGGCQALLPAAGVGPAERAAVRDPARGTGVKVLQELLPGGALSGRGESLLRCAEWLDGITRYGSAECAEVSTEGPLRWLPGQPEGGGASAWLHGSGRAGGTRHPVRIPRTRVWRPRPNQ